MIGNGLVIHNSQRDVSVRDSHAALEGETVDLGDKFSNGLRFPGDTDNGNPGDWCNCRCNTVGIIPNHQRTADQLGEIWKGFSARVRAGERAIEREFRLLVGVQRVRVLAALRAGGVR